MFGSSEPSRSTLKRLADKSTYLCRSHASALRLYNRAIRAFQQNMKDGKATPALALVSCALFFCIEVIRDDVFAALALLTKGAGLLRQFASTISNENESGLLNLIQGLFARQGMMAGTLGQGNPMYVPAEFVISEQCGAFTNMTEARNALFGLMGGTRELNLGAEAFKESLITENAVESVCSGTASDADALDTMFGMRFRFVDEVSTYRFPNRLTLGSHHFCS